MSATVVWNDSAGVLTRGVTPPTVTPPPPVTGGRFQGDAGVGKIRLGQTGATRTLDAFDTLIFGSTTGARQHSIGRSYQNDSTAGGKAVIRMPANTFTELNTWVNAGRMPMWSFKAMEVVAGAYKRIRVADILSGSRNADLDYNFAQIDKLAGPVFGVFWHEPEDDFPVTATAALPDTSADYRAAYQYIIRRWNAGNHKNLVWCSPFFMAFTFKTTSGRDFRDWHPNWDGSKWLNLVKVDACDFYNPQAAISAGDVNETWATQANRFLNARAKVGAPALPWIIGELGVSNAYTSMASTGYSSADFLLDMVQTGAKSQGLVAVCVWDNGPFAYGTSSDVGNVNLNGWKAAVAQANVVLA